MKPRAFGAILARWCFAIVLATASGAFAQEGGPSARTVQPDGAVTFEAAQAAYERNQWPQAYAAFAHLADDGHGEAARIALQMWRHGPRLFGQCFQAAPARRDAWRRAALQAAELRHPPHSGGR